MFVSRFSVLIRRPPGTPDAADRGADDSFTCGFQVFGADTDVIAAAMARLEDYPHLTLTPEQEGAHAAIPGLMPRRRRRGVRRCRDVGPGDER